MFTPQKYDHMSLTTRYFFNSCETKSRVFFGIIRPHKNLVVVAIEKVDRIIKPWLNDTNISCRNQGFRLLIVAINVF